MRTANEAFHAEDLEKIMISDLHYRRIHLDLAAFKVCDYKMGIDYICKRMCVVVFDIIQ